MTTKEAKKSKFLEDMLRDIPKTIKNLIKTNNWINKKYKELPVELENYIWWVKHFSEYKGFISALKIRGLKEKSIIQTLKKKFIDEGVGEAYFIQQKQVLEGLIKKGQCEDPKYQENYQLLLKAYDAYLTEQNLKQK